MGNADPLFRSAGPMVNDWIHADSSFHLAANGIALLLEESVSPTKANGTFELSVVTQLQVVLLASRGYGPGLRLDTLAVSLGSLANQCAAYGIAMAQVAQAEPLPYGPVSVPVDAAQHAQSMARAARNVFEAVRARALALNKSEVEALWKP